jgi:hypothetical protein
VLEDRLAPASLITLASNLSAPPLGSLAEDSHGNLFGTTGARGTNTYGTVFEVAAGSGALCTSPRSGLDSKKLATKVTGDKRIASLRRCDETTFELRVCSSRETTAHDGR